MSKKVISIGNQSFIKLRENDCYYIDKTDFIKEWWENKDDVTLITRPRRFGKTFNMSMLDAFFSIKHQDKKDLFKDLSIWQDEKMMESQGKYPVIFLSFATVKGIDFRTARNMIVEILVKKYDEYDHIKDNNILSEKNINFINRVNMDMTDEDVAVSLHNLSLYLNKYYNKNVIILLDEYDTPLQEAYINGYWDEMVAFIRSLFNATFKTNPYLERAVMTGITRVSKESIFSDLNNLKVCTTMDDDYADCFGFTEKEVFNALDEFGLEDKKAEVKEWYDGFNFGDKTDIYNPWSITNYIDKKGKIETYWANTSSNGLVNKLIKEGNEDIKIDMESLLRGEVIKAKIDKEMVYSQLDDGGNESVWSLLLGAGYLKAHKKLGEEYENIYQLVLTNKEVKMMFENMISGWFKGYYGSKYNRFLKALMIDDLDYMNDYMADIVENMIGTFDSGIKPSKKSQPERFYHGLVLGLLVDLKDRYEITSNRESGLGRYDVMLKPKNKEDKAFIFEFKVRQERREKSLEETLEAALKQIKERNYEQRLIDEGIEKDRIYHYGFAFQGKQVLIG